MKKILYVLFFIISLSPQKLYSMMQDGDESSRDPLARTNYRLAFDQKDTHVRYRDLLTSLGCDTNVFEEIAQKTQKPLEQDKVEDRNYQSISLYQNETTPISSHSSIQLPYIHILEPREDEIDEIMKSPEWEKYKKDCLSKLQHERRWSITRSAREAVTMLALMGTVTIAAVEVLGINSFGGSMTVSVAFFNSIIPLRTIIKSTYDLFFPPSHPLDELEKRFALDQCFIPKPLWPTLIKKFMIARQNPFSQQDSMNFIEFSLGLTTYYPKPSIKLKNCNVITEKTINKTLKEISGRINIFFRDYQSISKEQYSMLKMGVFKFVLSLLDKDKPSRYLYLLGSGGIGKTYFTQQLCSWMEELIPNSVHFERFIVTSSEELEGSTDKPGVFLRLLRNQCLAKKRGSVVLIDEGNWLNREDMISPAKRVFNGGLTQLSTSYFGTGIDGTGIHLDMPSMLVIVSSNEEIKNDALRSRFDTIEFPSPTKEALNAYRLKLLEKNDKKRFTKLCSKDFKEKDEEEISPPFITFRDVEAAIPALLLN